MAKKKHGKASKPVNTSSTSTSASKSHSAGSADDAGSATGVAASKPTETAAKASAAASSYAEAAAEPPAPTAAVVPEDKPVEASGPVVPSANGKNGVEPASEAEKSAVPSPATWTKSKGSKKTQDDVPDSWDGADDGEADPAKTTSTTANTYAEAAAEPPAASVPVVSADTEILQEATPANEKPSRRIVPQPSSSRQRSPIPQPLPGSQASADRPRRSAQADKRRVSGVPGTGADGKDEVPEFDFDAKQRAEAGAPAKRIRTEGSVVDEPIGAPSTEDEEDLTLVVPATTHEPVAASKDKTQPGPSTVEKHVKFFDRHDRGIISPLDTFVGFQALGFNLLLSIVSVLVIHGGFSWPSQGFGMPDWQFRLQVDGMPGCKHGSDSGTYDTDGEFVEQKFEAIWDRWSKDGNSMGKLELWNMTSKHRLLFDPFGWAAQIFEWVATWLLLADANGRVHKADVKDLYSGDLFYRIAKDRRQKQEKQTA